MKHRREGLESNALLSLLHAKVASVVLVLSVQRLDGNVVFKRLVDVFLIFDVKLNVVEGLGTRGAEDDVLAANERLKKVVLVKR